MNVYCRAERLVDGTWSRGTAGQSVCDGTCGEPGGLLAVLRSRGTVERLQVR